MIFHVNWDALNLGVHDNVVKDCLLLDDEVTLELIDHVLLLTSSRVRFI